MNKHFSDRLLRLKQEDNLAYQEFTQSFRSESRKKGESLITLGKTPKDIFFIKEGLARHYKYDEEGREFNTWFSFEDSIVLPIDNFMNRTPSKIEVELMEDTTYDYIPYKLLDPLLDAHHSIERLFREMLMLYYIELEAHIYRRQAYSAQKRYDYLVSERPHILQRLSQAQVASYLGITRETLSRTRAKSRKN